MFDKNKIKFLPDAILNISSFRKNINETIIDLPKDKRIILSAGRLTKQKNFIYLIKEFEKFSNINNDFVLIILGDGEEKKD